MGSRDRFIWSLAQWTALCIATRLGKFGVGRAFWDLVQLLLEILRLFQARGKVYFQGCSWGMCHPPGLWGFHSRAEGCATSIQWCLEATEVWAFWSACCWPQLESDVAMYNASGSHMCSSVHEGTSAVDPEGLRPQLFATSCWSQGQMLGGLRALCSCLHHRTVAPLSCHGWSHAWSYAITLSNSSISVGKRPAMANCTSDGRILQSTLVGPVKAMQFFGQTLAE